MMMVLQIITAGGRHGMQLMIGQLPPEVAARRLAGAEKEIAGVRQAVKVERGPQAPLVERRVVCHERQPVDQCVDLGPHILELGRLVGIGAGQTVHLRVETAVEIRARPDQPIDFLRHLAVAHDDHAHRTDARPVAVGRLEIDRCEIHEEISFMPGQISGNGAFGAPSSPLPDTR